MNNCSEFVLDDLMAITAVPAVNIPASLPTSPANSLSPTISASGFSPSLTGSITIGQKPAVQGGALVPIKRFTGKAKDDESDSVAGRLHTVSVTCEVDGRDSSADSGGRRIWDYLLQLERGTYHLLLTFRDGVTRAFVSASEDTYLFNAERDGSKTTVTFRIQNLMGIQLIV